MRARQEGAEGEREREREMPKQAPSRQLGARHRAQSDDPGDRDLSQCLAS